MIHQSIVRLSALVLTLAACSSGVEAQSTAEGPEQPTPTVCPIQPLQDGKRDAGVVLPTAGAPGVYCAKLGYKYSKEGNTCIFPDGSECDDSRFYAGLCAENYSYCNTHGGKVSLWKDPQQSTALPVCTLPNGDKCFDHVFAETGDCANFPF
jgi:putative hemolysin